MPSLMMPRCAMNLAKVKTFCGVIAKAASGLLDERNRLVDGDLVLRVVKIYFRTRSWILFDQFVCFFEGIDKRLKVFGFSLRKRSVA